MSEEARRAITASRIKPARNESRDFGWGKVGWATGDLMLARWDVVWRIVHWAVVHRGYPWCYGWIIGIGYRGCVVTLF
jgi:hypothetical protein